MNPLAQQFFTANKEDRFKKVRFLHEEKDVTWEQISKEAYDLPRGWFELSRISARDRVDFTRDYWLNRIPYHPRAHPMLFEFFERLDDVAVILLQKRDGEPFDAELVYSLADNSTFFRGQAPCLDSVIQDLKSEMDVNLPRDYLSFLKIHNGFGKLSEMGLIEAEDIFHAKRRVMDLLLQTEKRIRSGLHDVDPGSLIPFFEALGLSSFQCFYTDWYPGTEMGNVYLSGIDYTISDVTDKKNWMEHLAFPSFSEWFAYYLQGMDLCT